MALTVHNTLSGGCETFKPLSGNTVNMYVCGITPYDSVHLGHARVYVIFDVIRRYLSHSGYNVNFVQNFTDIDDKIINRAMEKGVAPVQLAETYMADYFTQMDKLNVLRAASYPRVSQTIPQIIKFVRSLIDKGAAYERNGDVLFSVRKFPGYGKLSKRNLDDLKSGARVEIDEEKNDPLDFALWKRSKPNEPPEVCWDSPWGKGRPGWHIECSVMSTEALGSTLDIHGGGQDLIFPHHENEIAQSEAATGKPFAKYWIHNGFVTVNKEKMSKSLGNFFTLSDILAKYQPRVVRYYLLGQHYRSPLDFSDDKLQAAANALAGLDNAILRLAEVPAPLIEKHPLENLESAVLTPLMEKFNDAMDDDFSTEKAIAVLHELKNDILNRATIEPAWAAKAFNTIKLFLEDYLGIPMLKDEAIPKEVEALAVARAEARAAKDWKRSDELRAALTAAGYKIEDIPGNKFRLLKI